MVEKEKAEKEGSGGEVADSRREWRPGAESRREWRRAEEQKCVAEGAEESGESGEEGAESRRAWRRRSRREWTRVETRSRE
jgi:hypothetical protein